MKFPRQKRGDYSVNLTPLIDVVFLLLIFFMVSTTFTRETRLKVELPEAQGEQAQQDQVEQIEIFIARDGAYAVNGQTLVNRKVETVMAAIKQLAGENIEVPLVITADASATHRAVVTVMDAAGRLGIVNLSITTQEPQEQSD